MTPEGIRGMRVNLGDSQVTQCEFLREIAAQLAELNRNIGELTIVLANPLVKVEPPYDSNVHDHPPFDKRFKRDRS